jgi:hypothetical protein
MKSDIPRAGEERRVTTLTATCEYVSVSASLQQTIRDREMESDAAIAATAPLDGPCGKPADEFLIGEDGSERSFCSGHLSELRPDWALARHP